MGFVKDVALGAAKLGTFGLAGQLIGHKKKKDPLTTPSMISSPTTVTPMIGPGRGGY